MLWHWHRPGATALIGPLAWQSPDAMDAALRSPKSVKMMEELGAPRFHNATFVSVSLRRLMPIRHLGREWGGLGAWGEGMQRIGFGVD